MHHSDISLSAALRARLLACWLNLDFLTVQGRQHRKATRVSCDIVVMVKVTMLGDFLLLLGSAQGFQLRAVRQNRWHLTRYKFCSPLFIIFIVVKSYILMALFGFFEAVKQRLKVWVVCKSTYSHTSGERPICSSIIVDSSEELASISALLV